MKDRNGIRDWPAKQAFLRALHNVLNNKALVEDVVGRWVSSHESHNLMDEVEKCYETFRRWGKSNPRGDRSKRFWKQIIDEQGLEVGISQLCTSPIIEFVAFFKDRSDIGVIVSELIADTRVNLDSKIVDVLMRQYGSAPKDDEVEEAKSLVDEYHIRGHMGMCFLGPLTGVEEGRVQSTMFYNVPEAALAWAALVESQNYSMYLECLLSLKELVASEHWDNALRGSGHVYDLTPELWTVRKAAKTAAGEGGLSWFPNAGHLLESSRSKPCKC